MYLKTMEKLLFIQRLTSPNPQVARWKGELNNTDGSIIFINWVNGSIFCGIAENEFLAHKSLINSKPCAQLNKLSFSGILGILKLALPDNYDPICNLAD